MSELTDDEKRMLLQMLHDIKTNQEEQTKELRLITETLQNLTLRISDVLDKLGGIL